MLKIQCKDAAAQISRQEKVTMKTPFEGKEVQARWAIRSYAVLLGGSGAILFGYIHQ